MQCLALTAPLALVLLAGCAPQSPQALVDEASQALGASRFEEAYAAFEAALAQIQPSDALFERAQMGAIRARISIDAEAAETEFLRYAAEHGDLVDEADYRDVAGRLSDVGAYVRALAVLRAGIDANGKSAALDQMIARVTADSRKAEQNPELLGALEELEALGYVGDSQ